MKSRAAAAAFCPRGPLLSPATRSPPSLQRAPAGFQQLLISAGFLPGLDSSQQGTRHVHQLH